MTEAQFSNMYTTGFSRTVAFLMSRGIRSDADEFAQAAWVRGWERRDQIRCPETWFIWINSIALNLVRERSRRERTFEELPVQVTAQARKLSAAVDAATLLSACTADERFALEQHYLYGYTSSEVAIQSGCSSVAVRLRVMRALSRLRASALRKRRNASTALR